MSVEEWALVASVVFSGLWSGLLAMLVLILHRVMVPMSGPEFARFLQRFLPAAEIPFNYIEVIGLVAPVVALIALADDPAGAAFVLTAVGLALTIAGPLLVSNRLAEPNYKVIRAWDPDAMPPDWEGPRRRYFALNWIRAVMTWAAFGLFLAALVEVF